MHLNEFDTTNTRPSQRQVLSVLRQAFGRLERVGGNRRVYKIGNEYAAVFLYGSIGFGISWDHNNYAKTVYFWTQFSLDRSPDFAVDLPMSGDIEQYGEELISVLMNPQGGKAMFEAAGDDFVTLARNMYGPRISDMTIAEIKKVANDNGVPVPDSITKNVAIRNGDRFDLTKLKGPVVNKNIPSDNEFTDLVNLGKAKTVKRLASAGKIALFARSTNGELFEIPGLDEYASQLERIASETIGYGNDDDKGTMEEQYDLVRERAKLIASGKSAFVKSLLVIGAPSSGKTFSIMDTIKSLGLTEGKDYVVKKGNITAAAMYRTLIEQIDGLTIFDDCDSVVGEAKGVDMLKGALDTDPIREVSYDVKGTLNTGAMTREERIETVDSISRILKGTPTAKDMNRFAHLLAANKKRIKDGEEPELYDEPKPRTLRDISPEDDEFEARRYGLDKAFDEAPVFVPTKSDLGELQSYFGRVYPNKIDFRGRIIFISNMPKEKWPSPILTRAFYVNMQFNSGEMLDFIDRIKKNLKANISEEQKQEVIDWIRHLYTAGKFKTDINFRIVQQAFDLRMTSNWKKMVSLI